MKNIRFEFTCSRQVPLYAHLCNQYLNHDQLDITVGYQKQVYFIEALGELKQLESLADAIAQDFLISVWLTDSRISLIDSRMGSHQLLPDAKVEQEFCQQCLPKFGDNQSPLFGDISLKCDCCHGASRLHKAHLGLSYTDLVSIAETLLRDGAAQLPNKTPITLSLSPLSHTGRDKLLICNPNTLNAQFHLKDHHILALSSIEKPLITARPVNEHPKLDAPLYDLCFAYNRAMVVLCEILRLKGIDWLYFHGDNLSKPMVWIQSAWSTISSETDNNEPLVVLDNAPEPLHDEASFNGIVARWKKGLISCTQSDVDGTDDKRSDAGLCALHAGNLESGQGKNSAVIYFSQEQTGQIVTLDRAQNAELFFSLPTLPSIGYDIYHHLEQSPQRDVVNKFKQKYPDDYLRLLDLNLASPTDNLQSLWAIAAVILGIPTKTLTKDALSDALIGCAMAHRGSNSPRIDYPLTKGEAHRSLNWCKTLGSLISFRLADDRDSYKLAFGMQDSLADFLANWIEHQDLNIGISSVVLAGSEFANEVLTQRLSLRLGNNFPLKINHKLDLDGNNLAVGGLYLKKRRQ
ncbi:NiFe hydrogenase [Shewanella benthica]|uniref:NiFe hydrogenase n=1 Tax=Shewanella benthica TaxID=43661 RepID=UPI001879D550|nr:NiFe hydrogenase [Shewanella benthica]MBE7215207.1 NiFe hydrogenase [Shewanella benthica]MCL1062278.1 NiFe hydrogenase [Shewanella benthica]